MKRTNYALAVAASLALGIGLASNDARACGGFFCSQSQGVNQAAERIVFANNGDDTVTAVIEIQYAGPAEKFSWLLPISSVPMGDQIAVGSSRAFQLLQQASNPQYSLTTVVEGTCDPVPVVDGGFGGTGNQGFPSSAGGAGGASAGPGGVMVEASGLVGSFEWTVISIDEALPEPVDAAVEWLTENGYDVPEGARGLLGPYLMDGMYLLALRLQKGASAGSIRPIVLTYSASRPMIPIKLTAVAANENMGVMTWVLADAQAVPKNYNALELNEARINWFNANSNYNAVVTEAADEAGGQGFVTEYAQPASNLVGTTWTEVDAALWNAIETNQDGVTPSQLVDRTLQTYAGWDGFWDVFREHVTLPPQITLEQIQACPFCTHDGLVPSPEYLAALESDVIEPAQVIEKLLAARPFVTRLYSTLSAAEMTVDPLFTYNADLEPISNLHTAERIIECAPGYYPNTAPWRIELPQGGVIRGGPQDIGNWPASFADQPANRRILRQGEAGPGQVLEDNGPSIDAEISTYSDSLPAPPRNEGAGGSGTGPGGGSSGDGPGATPDETSGAPNQLTNDQLTPGGGCGCRAAGEPATSGLAMALLLGLSGWWRRRKR
jgi:MYXO-CTERM domain-containing protein